MQGRQFLLLFACVVLGGCQALYPPKPVAILARDGETQQPIPGTHIEMRAPGTRFWESGTTDQDGVVRLPADAASDVSLSVQAAAEGYLFEQTYIPAETLRAIKPAPRFGRDEVRPVAFVVDLYASPAPTVELVVPAGYRGIIKAKIHIPRDVPCPPGQRLFRFPVSPQGIADVTGPTLLERTQPVLYQVRFADDAPLSRSAGKTELGYWWLRHDSDFDFYYLGTKGEYAGLRWSQERHWGGDRESSGSGTGSGHGHHRHGGATPES